VLTRKPTINGRKVETIDKDLAALELRRQGFTYQQIADRTGYANRSAAYQAVQRGLALSVRETADEVRQLEIERLEDLRRPALEVLRRRHLVVSQGKVMHDPDTGEPLIDSMPALHAIDRLIKLAERMAAFRGLDAPRRSVSEVLTLDVIQAEILRLKSQVAPEQLAAIERDAGEPLEIRQMGGDARTGANGGPPADGTVTVLSTPE
jgi:hypothetical protein